MSHLSYYINTDYPVADLKGVRGVQMHPPLAASKSNLRRRTIVQQF